MNIKDNVIILTRTLAHQLSAVYSDPLLCDQYAWWMLESITGKTKAELVTAQEPILNEHSLAEIERWMHALVIEKEPLQYLIGSVPFCDVDIAVKPPTLIPRPETEEWCINLIHELQKISTQLSILDMCCGTGCIALALANALPSAKLHALDKAPAALELAKYNAERNAVTTITFMQSDLFTALSGDTKFDLIVCNPPYIAPEEWGSLDDSVTGWEDRDALIAEDQGLELIKKIIKQAPNFIQPNTELATLQLPQLMLEIGYQQGTAVSLLMEQEQYTNVIVHKDLEGKDRVVSGRIPHVATTQNHQ